MIKKTGCFLALLALSACASNSPVYSGRVSANNEQMRVDVAFTSTDRQYIRDYYTGHAEKGGKGLPPGLAKKERMPPGHEKQLVRNGTLPPGLQRQALPNALEARLSPLSGNYVRVRVGQDIVLMDARTNVMLDIIYNLGQ